LVDLLARIAGVSGLSGEEYDWPAVEARLGVPLPADYKELLAVFPRGLFRGLVRVSRPGEPEYARTDFLGFNRYRLDDMRVARAAGHMNLPYPVFPEPGGLLLWGVGVREEHFFWVTEKSDPADWNVVVTDGSYTGWTEFPGGMGEFLVEVATGRWDTSPLGGVDLGGEAPFLPEPVRRPATALHEKVPYSALGGLFWELLRAGEGRPEDRYGELARLLGPPPAGARHAVDWEAAERLLGTRLPADYKRFVDVYGAGVLADIAVCAPGSPGEFDLGRLLRRKHLESQGAPPGPFYPPVHPDPAGLISWGETPDGWTCGWVPSGPDPDEWGVVIAGHGRNLAAVTYADSESFSSFLVKHVSPGGQAQSFFFGREP
jgi:hypothetical protein